MIKQITAVLAWALIFFSSGILACGPYYEPRYSSIAYMDPGLSGRHNFNVLLQDYLVPAKHQEYHDRFEQQAQYLAAVKAQIATSNRPIYVNLTAQDLSDGLCAGNDPSSRRAIQQEFRELGDLAPTFDQDHFSHVFGYLNGELNNICGPYTRFANQQEQVDSWLKVVRDFQGPSPWQDYSWLLMARYHVYAFQVDSAAPYLDKMAASDSAAINQYAKELSTLLALQKVTPMPLNLPLGSYDRYRYNGGYYAACVSNNIDNVLLFNENLLASAATDAQVVKLMQARDVLAGGNCYEMSADAKQLINDLTTGYPGHTVAAEYATYLLAAQALYAMNYDLALKQVANLKHATDAWLAETSHYLMGRIQLIKAQKNWNGYSDPAAKINKADVAAAAAAFDSYTATYPAGMYAKSVAGLTRRMAYFTGDSEAYKTLLNASFYVAADDLFNEKSDVHSSHFRDLFQEWRKYTDRRVEVTAAPALLVAHEWLNHSEEYDRQSIAAEAHKFTNDEVLLALLENWMLLQQGHAEKVVVTSDDMQFNTQTEVGLGVVMAKAALAQKNYATARDIWVDIHRSSEARKSWEGIRAEIAATYLAERDFFALADEDAHIDLLKIYQDAFLNVCDVADLTSIANNQSAHDNAKKASRYEAFVRYIHANDFKALHHLYDQINDPGEFAAIQTAVSVLAVDETNPQGLIELAHFMFNHIYHPFPEIEIDPRLIPQKSDLMACPSSYFGTAVFGVKEYYARIINQHSDEDKSEAEARALHYLVHCDRQSNHSAPCYWGKVESPLLTGKQAFKRLHRKYPDSEWTAKTPYYY